MCCRIAPSALVLPLVLGISGSPSFAQDDVRPDAPPGDRGRYTLGNPFLARTLSIEGGTVRTVEVVNRRTNVRIAPTESPEFRLRCSQGTHRPETAYTLTTADFAVTSVAATPTSLTFHLHHQAHPMDVELRYDLLPAEPYLHKRLTMTSGTPVVVERLDVEALTLPDAQQPYHLRQITATGPWKPGLGQPLFGTTSATFWGIEFPAADNRVRNGALAAGYLPGRSLEANEPYASYPAVMGVADDPRFISDAFLDYIERIRIRPMRLQVQYNSWFDHGGGVDHAKFVTSMDKVHHELVVERGNSPLNAYVIDDGWQDVGADWSDRVWKVNRKFDPDLAATRKAAADRGSSLGLWLSPGCFFGADGAVKRMKARGSSYESLDRWMSMAGPLYMGRLEERVVELAGQGVGYFKFDGLFGHLLAREFELHGGRYGLPEMPQLGLEGFTPGDKRLNDAAYDDLKIYYLTAGTERLIHLCQALAKADPKTFIALTNGAYLSPWWLQHVDVLWLINCGDAATGKSRTDELVYRDGFYHDIWRRENTQFPIGSIFNHEPKKTSTGESKDAFRSYLYMSLSRGTGFIELYLRPLVLLPGDWDVLSEGLFWAQEVFPAFSHVRLHGGDPRAGAAYGYAGWTRDMGYLSVHNPGAKACSYEITLDRACGLFPGSGPFLISSPLAGSTVGLPPSCTVGDLLTIPLQPGEVRILHFSTVAKDWSRIRNLQQRSPETLGR